MYQRLVPGEGGFRQLYRRYRKDARRRGISWDLSPDEFRDVVSRPCFFCDASHVGVSGKGHGRFTFTGVDRWDNDKSYCTGNVVACCGRCNFAKGRMHGEEFLSQVKAIAIKHWLCS